MSQPLTPPTAIDSEIAVLTKILLSRDALDEVSDILRPDDFAHSGHRLVYRAALEVAEIGEAYDAVVVAGVLSSYGFIGAGPLLAELLDATFVPNVVHHAKVVAARARQRALILGLQRMAAEGYTAADPDEWIRRVELAVYELTADRDGLSAGVFADEAMREAMDRIGEAQKEDGAKDFLPTTSADLNRAIGGFDIGYPTVIAARPGVGKTSFCVQQMMHMVGKPYAGEVVAGACFSIEMPRAQLMIRAVCQHACIESKKVRRGELNADDWRRAAESAGKLGQLPFIIDDTSRLTVPMIRSRLRRYDAQLKRKHGPQVRIRFVLLDYAGLMDTQGVAGEEGFALLSKGLKAIAKDFAVVLIVIVSMNRDQAKGSSKGGQRRPQLSDLKNSGQWEYDASIVGYIYKPSSDLPEAERSEEVDFILAKVRQDECRDIPMHFEGRYQLFRDAEQQRQAETDAFIGADFDNFDDSRYSP